MCSTKGLTPADRLADDTSATPTGRHPLIRQLPNISRSKRLARHRVPTLRAEVLPQTEQRGHQRAVPERPRQHSGAQTHQSRYRTDRLDTHACSCTHARAAEHARHHDRPLLGAVGIRVSEVIQLTFVDDSICREYLCRHAVESNQTGPQTVQSRSQPQRYLGCAFGVALDSECPFSPMSLRESTFHTLSEKMFAGGRQAVLHRPDGSAAKPRRRNSVRTSVTAATALRVMTS